MDNDHERLVMVCIECDGVGMVPDPKLAIMDGVPQTLDPGKPCPTCSNRPGRTGHTEGFQPPV